MSNAARTALLLSVAALGCSAPPESGPSTRDVEPPPRLESSLQALGRIASGERTELDRAILFVPDGFEAPLDGAVPLYVHFQGGPQIAEENFVRMERPGVVIASTLSGLSSAFSKPYRDTAVFHDLLRSGEAALSTREGVEVTFDPVVVTFFSAGYGAVREFLRDPALFERIDALVSVDSIYAGVVADDVRAPDVDDMFGFMRYAQAASRGEKVFVVAHGMYATPYASTAECADMLLASVAGQRDPSSAYTERGVPIAAEAHVGGFHLYTFDEATAGIHVDCLYMVPEWVRRHVPLDP